MSKSSPISGGLLSKGASAPPAAATGLARSVGRPKVIEGRRTTVTIKLDDQRFLALKLHAAKSRQTNQAIVVAALDAYLAKP